MKTFSSHLSRKASLLILLTLAVFGAKAQNGPGMPPPGGGGPDDEKLTTPTSKDVQTYSGKDFIALIRQTDLRSSFYDSDMTANMTMVMVSPEKGTMTRKEVVYRRDKDDAFLVLTLEPESKKGQGMLRVANNMWRYDPTSRKFTHTTLKEQYDSNSTVRNSDLRRNQRSWDYDVTSVQDGKLGKYDVWIADLKAKNDEVYFPYIKMWIDKTKTVVLKVEEYSLSKKLLRTSFYTQYLQIGTSYVPTVQIFQDGLVPEKRSQVTYTNISLKPIPDDVFTKNYLERMSQ